MNQDYNSYYHIFSNYMAGYQITTDPCVLKAVIVNCNTKSIVGIIDGTSGTFGSSTTIAVLGTNSVAGSYLYNCQLNTALRVVVKGGATIKPDITVVYRR